MIASDAAVGLVASSRKMYARWVLPLAHILALIFSSLFLFKKIKLFIALFLSSLVILLMLISSKTTRSCSCCISLCVAAIPFSPNFFMPYLKLYVCRTLKACKSSIPSKALFMCNTVITMICADPELHSSIWYALNFKYFHLCGGTLTLLVQRLTWFSSS